MLSASADVDERWQQSLSASAHVDGRQQQWTGIVLIMLCSNTCSAARSTCHMAIWPAHAEQTHGVTIRTIGKEQQEQLLSQLTLCTEVYMEIADTESGEIQCAVCLESFCPSDAVRKLHCGHVYHASCFENWILHGEKSCPMRCSTVPVQAAAQVTKVENEVRGERAEEDVERTVEVTV